MNESANCVRRRVPSSEAKRLAEKGSPHSTSGIAE